MSVSFPKPLTEKEERYYIDLYENGDENAKEEALKLFERFGMDASTAVNIFFKKVVQTKSIPFEISAVDTNYKTTYDMSKEEFMGRVQSAIDNRTV